MITRTESIEQNSDLISGPNREPGSISRVALVGNYLPAKCGIATFTADLTEAMAGQYPGTNFIVLPTSDPNVKGGYPERVRFIIEKEDRESYRQAAYYLNMNHVDLVCLQHEYGIFGGTSGEYILSLLQDLQPPLVTTFHTVLDRPTPEQERIFTEIISLSDHIVVMTRRDMGIIRNAYQVPHQKIEVIPHGIPDVPFIDPNFFKDQIGVEGQQVILTFGLLSANKGIEYVIQALPAVLERHSNVKYILLGATHPNVLREEGEVYRESLVELAEKLGVSDNVIFHNRFVSLDKLIEYISTADIYVTPYLSKEQSVSGTLSYAVGAGKAVISTPYWHAEELLAEGRGLLVPFRDAPAIAEKILYLLDNEVKRHTLRKRAYLKTREMVWEESARKYMLSFSHSMELRRIHPQPVRNKGALKKATGDLPILKTGHLQRMTDGTGMLQHAIHAIPRFEHGYSADDNARALIAAVMLEDSPANTSLAYELASRYISFLWFSFNKKTARFRNMLDFSRNWLDDGNSEDTHGRAMWALGTVVGRSRVRGLRDVADHLFQRGLPAPRRFKSPRACAFTIVGIHEYSKRFTGDQRTAQVREKLVRFLVKLFEEYSRPEWPWFEPYLTYCNAKLPEALLVCGPSMADDSLTQLGLETLEWLVKVQTSDEGYFVPIGSNGFYHRGKERSRFDQQPIEACCTVTACIEAYHITGDEKWRRAARQAFDWFLGRNDLQLSLYDPRTGGCRDGLHPDRANRNQGAESTLAFLIALMEISTMEKASVQEVELPGPAAEMAGETVTTG